MKPFEVLEDRDELGIAVSSEIFQDSGKWH